MPLRRSLAALAFSLCALGVTGCENGSFEFKGPSISFSQNYIDEGIQKFNAGDYEGALLVFNEMIEIGKSNPIYNDQINEIHIKNVRFLNTITDGLNNILKMYPNHEGLKNLINKFNTKIVSYLDTKKKNN